MKLIFIILALLLNQNDNLIKQHHAEVNVYDIDSYIHDLPDEIRQQISYDKRQLEIDILGMLNMNIIYDYIQKSGLIDKAPFEEIVNKHKEKTIEINEEVSAKLKIDTKIFRKNYRLYLLKKKLYSALQDYLTDNIEVKKAEALAYDRFLVNRNEYMIPEKRDIGLIQISQDKFDQEGVLELLKKILGNDDIDYFKKNADLFSHDKTVRYNHGQLGIFNKNSFRFPFADEVFSANVGTIPAIFEEGGYWYIVRVNTIIPEKQLGFEEIKSKIVPKIKVEMMERQFQSIIDQYAKHKVQVNKEIVDDIFSRYEVFQ